MSSFSSDPGILDISFRKNSYMDEDDPIIDTEIEDVLEQLRQSHPDCDRLGEIKAVVEYCRTKLKECVETGDATMQQSYMDKIVKLGLERQQLEDCGPSSARVRVKGHDFVLQPTRGRHNPCCEVCMHTIWRLVQSWRRCEVCGLRAHDQCASEVHRSCAGLVVGHRDFSLSLEMGEEKGLSAQDYSCAECQTPLMYEGAAHMEPRLCDYSGLLFCPNCHWGDQWSIPARIVLNMDSSPRPVCRAVKQMLSIVDTRPMINMGTASSSIFKYHKDLARVHRIRQNFLFMKCYFISCRTARKLRILQYLNAHQHFVENSDMYSLKELRELCEGELLPELEAIHSVFRRHIEEECETCKFNGFYCELCEDPKMKNELLYHFTEGTTMCQECMAVFHLKCYEKHSMHCPRCERRRKRAPVDRSLEDD